MSTEKESLQHIGQCAYKSLLEMVQAYVKADKKRNSKRASRLADERFEEAERAIMEDPLSLEFRSGWEGTPVDMTATEYRILLSTGGPATCIMGELDDHGEPTSAKLYAQDWFQPWTEIHSLGDDSEAVLLTYVNVLGVSGGNY